LDLTFFGLTSKTAPQYRINVLTEVHDLVFHGKGGYIWSDVYNMPIYLRRFALSKLREHYNAANKASQPPTNPNTSTLVDSSGKVNNKIKTSSSPQYK
tara:strand:+ start:1514 stop:1807 length:294 start_codon:yes stop_codon:yes gene_type:complete